MNSHNILLIAVGCLLLCCTSFAANVVDAPLIASQFSSVYRDSIIHRMQLGLPITPQDKAAVTPYLESLRGSIPSISSIDTHSSAPDSFGYTWIDNNNQTNPPGPSYEWIDISESGTTGPTGDDYTSAMVPLGFTFPFYGNNYTSVTMSTDGWLSVNSTFANLTSGYYSQYLMPSTSMPRSLIAVLYRDSYVTVGDRYIKYQQYNDTTFIVQWFVDTGERYQVLLYASGSIKMQYNTASTNTGTIGLQNDSRTTACQYQYSITCPPSQSAILFIYPNNWVRLVAPANQTLGLTTDSIALTWTVGPRVDSCKLYCSTNQSDVENSVPTALVYSGTDTTYFMPISANNRYYWKVVGYGTTPSISTSPIWTFNTISALTGTKTINPAFPTSGDNFTSFSDAISTLYNIGVGMGGITFNVSPGTYVASVTMNGPFPGMGASSPVIFHATGPGVNISPTVITTVQYGVKLSGVQYVTFDGINVIDTSTGTYSLYYGYWVNNSSATQGAQYNTVKNASIQMRISASYTTYGVYQYCNSSFYPTSALGSQSYNRYLNLKISKVRAGVYCYSYSSYPDFGTEIGSEVAGLGNPNRFTIGYAEDDTIGGAGAAYGIYAAYQNGFTVHDIDIKNMKTYSTSYAMYGLYLYYCPYTRGTLTPTMIYNNRIYDFTARYNNGFSSIYGIYSYYYYTYGYQRIFNNMIYNLQQTFTGSTSAAYYTYGIYVGYYYPTILNNTIMLNQTGTQNFSSACLYYSSIYNFNDTCKNNIFANLGNQTSNTPYHIGMYMPLPSAPNYFCDYNNYYIPNTTGGYIGVRGAVYRIDSTSWRSVYPGVDEHSTFGDPQFINSTSNPHIMLHQSYSPVENHGTREALIMTDIDNEARNPMTPDIGADEGQFVTSIPTAATDPVPANGATGVIINPTLSWSASGGSTPISYDVYLGTTNPPTTAIATGLTNPSYMPATYLEPNSTYYWFVNAINDFGTTSSGTPWSFTTGTGASPNAPGTATSPITNLTTTSLTFNWVDLSTNETGFVIKRSLNGITFTDLTTAEANATFYTNSGLIPSTRYWYQVYATNSEGTSSGYASGNGWTLASVPGAPTFTGASFRTIQLTPTNGFPTNPSAATYAIHETTTNQFVQATGALGSTAVWQSLAMWGTVTVTGLSQATTYTFAVKARNGLNVETAYGPAVSMTTGDPFNLGPDAYGYRMIATNGTGYNWITPSASAITVSGWNNTDDGSAGPYNIGFNFSFYGRTYTTWYAGSNGRIQFGGQNPYNYTSATFPLTGGYPAGVYFWNYDMSVVGTTVMYENRTAPNRLVVTYTNLATLGGTGPIAAQVVIYEDGRVDVNYGPRNSTTQSEFAAAAIQDTNGINGCLQYGPPVPDSLRTYRFFRLTAPMSPVPDNNSTGVPINATLSWVGDANATGYDVYFGRSDPPPLVSSNQPGLTYTPATLDTMAMYYWRVASRMGSTVMTGPPWSFQSGRGIAPNAPDNGQFVAATLSTITGSFRDNSANETGFIVQRSLDGITFYYNSTLPAHAGSGIVTFVDAGLTTNTHYWYRVFSTNANATSTGFAAVNGSTLSLPTLAFTTTSSATPITSADLGIHRVGMPATLTYAVRNTGSTPLLISYVASSNPAVTTSWNSQTIAPGSTQNIDLIWLPTQGGAIAGTLTFISNAINNPVIINVTGTAMAVHNLPIIENFSGPFPPAEWMIINPDSAITWTQYNSPYSAHMNWWMYSSQDQMDYLITPIVTTVGVTSASFDFDWSHQYNYSYNDSLMIKYTLDGGASWSTIWKRWGRGTGDDSLPAGTGGSYNAPATVGTWGHASISLAGTGCLGQPYVQFALVSGNGYGPDLFVTNVRIHSSLIALLHPNGGETCYRGEQDTIRWTAPNLTGTVSIAFNPDYPAGTWLTLDSAVDVTRNYYCWTPAVTSTNCRIRIRSNEYSSVEAISDSSFSIVQRSVRLIQPNGGETYYRGEQDTIRWTASNLTGTVSIAVNSNYPTGTWLTLASPIDVAHNYYCWTPVVTSTNCRIRVRSNEYSYVNAISYSSFSIVQRSVSLIRPNGGEHFAVGLRDTIHFSGTYLPYGITIELNRNYPFGSWETLVDSVATDAGQWIFDPVSAPISNSSRIRALARGMTQYAYGDTSDNDFAIIPQAHLYQSADTLSFTGTRVGTTDSLMFKIANRSNLPFRYYSASCNYPAIFSVLIPDTDSLTVSNDSLLIWVIFAPDSSLQSVDTVRLTFESPYQSIALPVTGLGLGSYAKASIPSIEFPAASDTAQADSVSFKLRASGNTPIVITSMIDSPPFYIRCDSWTIQPGDSITVHIYFQPIAPGYFTGVVGIVSNAIDSDTLRIPVSGYSKYIPSSFKLFPAYPNPFNTSVNIKFDVPERDFVTITLYNSLGQKVSVLHEGMTTAGQHLVVWKSDRNSTGVYFISITAPGFIATKKAILLK